MKKIMNFLRQMVIMTLVLTLMLPVGLVNVKAESDFANLMTKPSYKTPVDSKEYKFGLGLVGEWLPDDIFFQCDENLTDDEVINVQLKYIELKFECYEVNYKNLSKKEYEKLNDDLKIAYQIYFNTDKTIKNRHYYAEFIRHYGYYISTRCTEYLECYNENYYYDITAVNYTYKQRYDHYWKFRKKHYEVKEEDTNFIIPDLIKTKLNTSFKGNDLIINWEIKNPDSSNKKRGTWISDCVGFMVTISTKKDFSKNKKRVFVPIMVDENLKLISNSFSCTFKKLNKYKDYYYKATPCRNIYESWLETVPKEKDFFEFKGTEKEGNKPHFLASYRPKFKYMYRP